MSAVLCAAGGALAWLLIRDEVTGRASACPFARLDRRHSCAVDGTPLAGARAVGAARRD